MLRRVRLGIAVVATIGALEIVAPQVRVHHVLAGARCFSGGEDATTMLYDEGRFDCLRRHLAQERFWSALSPGMWLSWAGMVDLPVFVSRWAA